LWRGVFGIAFLIQIYGLMAVQVSASYHGVNNGWWCLRLISAGSAGSVLQVSRK
jgi:hypothetical protein